MGARSQGSVSATGILSVVDVTTVDEPRVSAAGVLSVGTRDAPDVDRTNVSALGILSASVEGSGSPIGFSFMEDERARLLVDERGAYIIGQSVSAQTTLKGAAAARGILFGAGVNTSAMANTDYAALVADQCALLTWEGEFKPASIQPTQGNFSWNSVNNALAWSDSLSLPWRLHLLNYPAHDMAWVDETTVTAETWQGLIDSHFEAIATRLAAHSGNGAPTSIDVTNELADGSQADGFLRHAWYNAGGPAWCSYMFFKARELWPNTPLYLCQDLQEQIVPSFGDRFVSCLKIVDYLLSQGAPVDGINLQGHLGWNRPWDPAAFRDQLKEFRDRGLKIIVGEHDVRLGTETGLDPANYTAAYYDQRAAEMAAQYADIILPFIDGGEFCTWHLGDAFTPWGASQRPCLYDDDLNVKPAYYQALLEPMLTRR